MTTEPAAVAPAVPSTRRWRRWIVPGLCAGLLLFFGVLSYVSVLNKSPTFDENLHSVGGFVHRFFKDYRINPEDPALFGSWASIPHNNVAIYIDVTSPAYQAAVNDTSNQWKFVFDTLYRDPENEPIDFINQSRFMFVVIGVALGGLIAWWSWKVAGAAGAIVATTLYAFDPNFLAHAALIKNDVPLALFMLAMAISLWGIGRRGHWWSVLALCLVCGGAINTKFSGTLFAPMIVLMLLIRAILPGPWRLIGMNLEKIAHRLIAAGAICLAATIVSIVMTWSVYGFRFAATRDGELLNSQAFINLSRRSELVADAERKLIAETDDLPLAERRESRKQLQMPNVEQYEAHRASALPRFITWLEGIHALPQAWLFGFLYTYATTLIRSTFLMGDQRLTGWWYYFPMAMLFKTPLATLAAIFASAGVAIAWFALPKFAAKYRESKNENEAARFDWWTTTCIALPPLVYMFAAMTTNLNLGLRHILPVYPFLYIGAGLAAAKLVVAFPKPAKIVGAVLAIALAAETISACPNYLAFFNAAAGGSRGGIELLADSNLDWGQDLPAVAEWQKSHTDRPLYFSYFGIADPAMFKINYRGLYNNNPLFEQKFLRDIPGPAYVALSATSLQGIYIGDEVFAPLKDATPKEVLNGTIYIYEWPLK